MLTKFTAGARKLIQNTSGATAIEYGLIAAGIAIAIIAVVTTLGDELEGLFQTVADALSSAGSLA